MARTLNWMWVAPVLAVATACGSAPETVGQVRDRYRPQVNTLRTQLKALHGKIPGVASGMTARLDPAPIYNEDGSGNTDFLPLEKLLDGDTVPSVDLGLSRDVATALSWTGAASLEDPSARRSATPDIEKTFQHALATRYLVVYRASKVRVTGQRNVYQGGDTTVDAFVVDLKANTIVASLSAKGSSAGPITVDLPAGGRRNQYAEDMLYGAAIDEIKKEFADKLGPATGGSFGISTKSKGVLAASAP